MLSAKVASRDSRKQIQRQVKVLLEDCTSEELNNVLVSGDMEAFLKLAGTDALANTRADALLGEVNVSALTAWCLVVRAEIAWRAGARGAARAHFAAAEAAATGNVDAWYAIARTRALLEAG